MEEEIDKTTQDAMTILIAAGEARNECKLAYEAIASGNILLAEEKIAAADAKIIEAHHVQTDHIQGVFQGEKQDKQALQDFSQKIMDEIYAMIKNDSISD